MKGSIASSFVTLPMRKKRIVPITAPMAAYMNNHRTVPTYGRIITLMPAYATADPTRPPTSACVADIGIPICVEEYTQITAANIPMTITKGVKYIGSTIPFPMVLCNGGSEQEWTDHVEKRSHRHRFERRSGPVSQQRWRLNLGIIHTVDKIEKKGKDNTGKNERVHDNHECLIAISERVFATSSQLSVAISRCS